MPPGNIRLLRLVPLDKSAFIQCQLFDYRLPETFERECLYEALSYAWGSIEKPHKISVDGYDLCVTENLYKALSHLRTPQVERILWIDAICIDQNNNEERAEQVQLMAKVYCKASRVIVWLGDAQADSDSTLDAIRVAANRETTKSFNYQTHQQGILDLLQRPWFQRIWVRP